MTMEEDMREPILRLENITKEYPGVIALEDINLEFEKGKIHSIVGENGAGKSTLIKIITGAINQTSGKVYYKGKELGNNSPIHSAKLGIDAVYQELNMIPALSIAENIFYGNEKTNGIFLDKKSMEERSTKVLRELGLNISPKTTLRDIGIGSQQLVEIAKALIKNVEVLILDEPTASLTNGEIRNLFRIIHKLKNDGVSIIYISHRLDEVFEISDLITVFRDGEIIDTKEPRELTSDQLVKLMVGRELRQSLIVRDKRPSDEKVLELKNINTDYVRDVSLELFQGEILGIAGLIASGRTELANAIFGVDKVLSGEIIINKKVVNIKSPKDAIKQGIAFITEDRKDLGLMLDLPILENTSYSSLENVSHKGIINKKQEKKLVSNVLSQLQVKYSSLGEKVLNLSGGNQQKIVISKWLLSNCNIFIFDEPTRGIDVGAKEEIYNILRELTDKGKSIIMISSEMEEVMEVSDRILVMSNGNIVSEYKRGEVTSEQIFLDSASLLKERNNE